jgi:hypothetical protein
MQEQEIKLPDLHPNDRRAGGLIIPHCPSCQGQRKINTTHRVEGDPIAIVYIWCQYCETRTPHELDDRDAIILRPFR